MRRKTKTANATNTIFSIGMWKRSFQNLLPAKIAIRRLVVIFLLLPFCISLLSAGSNEQSSISTFVKAYYSENLDSLLSWTTQMKLVSAAASEQDIRKKFREGRATYKATEFITEYYFPASAARLNGAPLPEAEPAQNLEIIPPQGFQVLEEIVYDDLTEENRRLIVFETDNIIRTVNKLKNLQDNFEPGSSEILDALRLNIYSMMIKGIAGFDAPAALSGIAEAGVSLQTFMTVMQHFPQSGEVVDDTRKAIAYIDSNKDDFNTFNRAKFIIDYINPLCVTLHDFQVKAGIPFVNARRAINTRAKTLFDEQAFDPVFFAPIGTLGITDAQVQLGKKLFNEKTLSGNGKRSCASCHQSARAFTDSLRVNDALIEGEKLLRNTPSLLNAALQPSQFYDSRINFLEDQVHNVVTNRDEMNGNLSVIASNLSKNRAYHRLSYKAYGKDLSADIIRRSIASYIRSLTYLNSPFDQYFRGQVDAMSPRAVRGFNLFMGKAKCGTCHFLPLFNGVAPPFYQKIESEVLGVPAEKKAANAIIDNDSGKYHLYKIPHQLFAFKTVSVRNAELTAPYMHNGVFSTLEEVIDFYDKGGGAGIGITVDNQTLSPDKLDLSQTEKQDIIEFIKAITSKGF